MRPSSDARIVRAAVHNSVAAGLDSVAIRFTKEVRD